MLILDRYMTRLFIKVLLISFLSLTGLFIVIDAFSKVEEFLSHGRQYDGGVAGVLGEYYGARVLTFFDRTACLLALIAGMFSVAWLHYSNELTALMAAGVAKTRIVRPLMIGVATVSLLGVVNREFLIPSFREQLTRDARNWSGDVAQPMTPRRDFRTDVLLRGHHVRAAHQQIDAPDFRLPEWMTRYGRSLVAKQATYHQAKSQRPAGYLLSGVELPADLAELPSVRRGGRAVLLSPHDTDWLKQDECFLVSDVGFHELAHPKSWAQLSSSRQIVAMLGNPSLHFGADLRVLLHARLVQPFLDVTLWLLGLPLVLTRKNRNVFVVAGTCTGLVVGYYVVVLGCHALGSGALVNPAFAAWCPLMILVPLAYALWLAARE